MSFNLGLEDLFQQIIDTEQQVQNRLARVAEGRPMPCSMWSHKNKLINLLSTKLLIQTSSITSIFVWIILFEKNILLITYWFA